MRHCRVVMGRALELVSGVTIPVETPAFAEFVIEGHIVPGEEADEGIHRLRVGALDPACHRRLGDPAPQGRDLPGHRPRYFRRTTGLLAVPMEARLLKVLRQNHPNVTGVAMPKSGTCRMYVHIAI